MLTDTPVQEHLTLTETLQQRTAHYEQQLSEQARVISALSAEKSALQSEVQALQTRNEELRSVCEQHSEEQMAVEPGHGSELRSVRTREAYIYVYIGY